jgi:transcriptional regulator with XRE-family HTH domain
MAPENADLGRAIRRLRWERKLTIEKLAFAAKMHPTYLSGIERGRRNPTWAKITSLTGALGVSVPALMETAEQEAEVARAVRETRARHAERVM